jgi:glycosyltransferase involved in cell wall biosynthesis
MDLSLVVPCYNEEANLPMFFTHATDVFDAAGIQYEFVFIDDGSTDRTERVLRDFTWLHENVKVVCFSRNFGKESAIYAGLEHATGEAICIIDADLQQDPATALEMYRVLMENPNADCVAAVQTERKEGVLLRWLKRRFYAIFRHVSNGRSIPDASDFRVFRHAVGQALLKMPEYYRFSKGLFAWVGFNTVEFPYSPAERHSGKTKWSTHELFSYAINGITSFTTFPLTVATYIGFFASLGSLIYLIVVLLEKLIMDIPVPGYPTLVSLILLLGGLQLFVLGIMGVYLGRDYIEGKRRPIYIERDYVTSDDILEKDESHQAHVNERVETDTQTGSEEHATRERASTERATVEHASTVHATRERAEKERATVEHVSRR